MSSGMGSHQDLMLTALVVPFILAGAVKGPRFWLSSLHLSDPCAIPWKHPW